MAEGKNPPVGQKEKVLVLKQHRAKPLGETETRLFKPGNKYDISGIDKLQVLGSGVATRDLGATVPANAKRQAPKPEKPEAPENPKGK